MCNGYMLSVISRKDGHVEMFYSDTLDGLTKKVAEYYFILKPVNDTTSLIDMRDFFTFMYNADVNVFAKNKYEELGLSDRRIKVLKIKNDGVTNE